MDKKTLAIYGIGGIIALVAIAFTVILAINLRNKPIRICTTLLTDNMAVDLLKGYSDISDKDKEKYIKKQSVRDSYLELINGSSDVILTTTVDDGTISWLKENGVEIEKITIAKDAVVFVNNVNNSIENLSSKQMKGILSGKNKSWLEVGGDDKEIIVYPPISGSEESYCIQEFMGNSALAKPKYRLKEESLDNLIEATSEYLDTRENAMFYTTFYNMKNQNNDEIRLISLEDIKPSESSIKDGYYPAIIDIYAIIRKDSQADSQTRKFVQYITSSKGQATIEQCGYINLIK